MDATISAASAVLSPATIAAFGPTGAVALFMAWILWSYARGREERQGRLNEDIARTLREDQREIFERQSREIDALKVDLTAAYARLRGTEDLAAALRRSAYDNYALCRENTHELMNARQIIVGAKLMKPEDFKPLVWPTLPPT